MAEQKQGTVVIAPGVLCTIARLTTPLRARRGRDEPSGRAALPSSICQGDGIKVQVIDEAVILDVYIVAANRREHAAMSREIQAQVNARHPRDCGLWRCRKTTCIYWMSRIAGHPESVERDTERCPAQPLARRPFFFSALYIRMR